MQDEQVAAAYDARAAEYIALIGSLDQMEGEDIALIGQWRDETPGELLDAGCGPGLRRRALRSEICARSDPIRGSGPRIGTSPSEAPARRHRPNRAPYPA